MLSAIRATFQTVSSICDITMPLKKCCRAASTVVVAPPVTNDFTVKNEPVYEYMPGSTERAELVAALDRLSASTQEVPIMIGGEAHRTDSIHYQPMPHRHEAKVAKFYYATPALVQKAIDVGLAARPEWERVPLVDKFAIWLKAADLMAGKYRQELNAATMLGQSKTVIQAEIDSAAELIDFLRFNAYYAQQGIKWQPVSLDPTVTRNTIRWRGLEGFVAAVSPFNFTAIGGNLAYTPAMMGNTVIWKPSDTAVLSNYIIYKIMLEAGVPAGVVNFVPADGPVFGDTVTKSPYFAALNFTGSVPTFNRLWTQVGNNLSKYRNFPRLVGECGGKNFHFVHPSADVTSVVNGTIRSAFEYCGQKCSACSRIYVPKSLWPQVKEGLLARQKELKVDDVQKFDTFMGAVIDEKAFTRITSYIEHAKSSPNLTILAGGKYDKSKGFFVEPTIVETTDPTDKIMREEIFGPVVTVFVYSDGDLDATVKMTDETTPYALTGAVFAQDQLHVVHPMYVAALRLLSSHLSVHHMGPHAFYGRSWLQKASEQFKYSAGNFYINDKSTGSVVAQQPFGGARLSGTNDKAGGPQYSLKWASPQAVKQTFVQLKDVGYPYMG